MEKQVVGLVGPIASGIWVIADLLQEQGFKYFRLSDRIREEAQKRGLASKRAIWQSLGDELRAKHSSECFDSRGNCSCGSKIQINAPKEQRC